MRYALILVAACSSSSTTPAKPTPATPDAAIASTTSIDAAADAAPPPVTELANATVWMFRFHRTGKAEGEARLELWTLEVAGDRAVVLVDRKTSRGEQPWAAARASTYAGTASDDGKTMTVAVAEGPNKLGFECKRDKLDVAAANAVRQPHPRKGKYAKPCSGDPGRFAPAKTTKVDVLSCKLPDFDAPMLFAAEPGIEYLFVNDDCDQQGGGYRAIAKDGAIAPVR